MGYYSNFTIKIAEKSKVQVVNLDILADDLSEISGYTFENEGDRLELSEAKWYDEKEDMEKLSLLPQYKDVLFVIKGKGEESGDIWMAIARNGAYILGNTRIIYNFGDFEIDEKDGR